MADKWIDYDLNVQIFNDGPDTVVYSVIQTHSRHRPEVLGYGSVDTEEEAWAEVRQIFEEVADE